MDAVWYCVLPELLVRDGVGLEEPVVCSCGEDTLGQVTQELLQDTSHRVDITLLHRKQYFWIQAKELLVYANYFSVPAVFNAIWTTYNNWKTSLVRTVQRRTYCDVYLKLKNRLFLPLAAVLPRRGSIRRPFVVAAYQPRIHSHGTHQPKQCSLT